MSEAVLLAGKRGSGKSIGAIGMAARYLAEGRIVATNLNLRVEHLVPSYCATRWYRIPDWPSADDLHGLPLGNPDPTDEKNNGLLILDECATFLNSRQWQGNGRQEVINWLVQSRKYGWDLLLIAQHGNLIDKSVRESLIELQGTMRRMDKMQVPVLSPLYKYFTGKPLHFPRIHFVSLRYGFAAEAPVADRWFFRGVELYKGYDTLQKIRDQSKEVDGIHGLASMLSAWDLKGRYMSKWNIRRQMAAGGLVLGVLFGGVGGYLVRHFKPLPGEVQVVESVDPSVKVRGVIHDAHDRVVLLLSDGRQVVPSSSKTDLKGTRYLVGSTWFGS